MPCIGIKFSEPQAIANDVEDCKSQCLLTTPHNEDISEVDEENVENKDDGTLCPICLDNWTTSGKHRLCSLKCGHLFGLSCVNHWLNCQSNKSCPTCKKHINRKDIRPIYARKLIAVDTSEVESIRNKLALVTEEKNKLCIDYNMVLSREKVLIQKIDEYKRTIQKLTSKLNENSDCNGTQIKLVDYGKFYMDRTLEVNNKGGCRVMDCNYKWNMIAASAKSTNALFSGFGLRKINITHNRTTAFIPLHQKQIRDVAIQCINPWVISVSMDKLFKVVDCGSNSMITTFTCDTPLWSCCWDQDSPSIFYVGEQQGCVNKFDIRQMSQPLNILSVPGDMSPVVSVACITSDSATTQNGGVISCKLNSIMVFENTVEGYNSHQLPIEGPFVSMSFEHKTKQLLVSTRPTFRIPYSRHFVGNLEKNPQGTIVCNTVHCFEGSTSQKVLTRSCLVENKNFYVAAHHESSSSVFLWNVNSGTKAHSLSATDPILDLRGLKTDNSNYLVGLTEKKLEFFKFINC